MRRSGTGAPPVITNRMLERSTDGHRSARASASRRSGLPKPTETRCSSMSWRRRSGLGIVGHHDRSAHEQDRQDVHTCPADPEERGDRDRHVVASEVGGDEEIYRVPGHVAVRQHHRLRTPGRPRRMGQEQEVVAADRAADRIIGRLDDERLIIDRRSLDGAADRQQVPDRNGGRRLDHIVLDQHDRFGLREHERAFFRPKPVVHGRENRAELTDGEERLEERAVVRTEPRDPVTMPDAEAAEPVGQASDPSSQFVVGEGPGAGDQRRAIGRDPRSSFDPRAYAEVTRRDLAHRCRMTARDPFARRARHPVRGATRRSRQTRGRGGSTRLVERA